MKKPRLQSGFTLIELLVVIAIIGIFSALVVSWLQDARLDAQNSAMKLQARNMAALLELERTENGGLYVNYDIGAMGNHPAADSCSDMDLDRHQSSRI